MNSLLNGERKGLFILMVPDYKIIMARIKCLFGTHEKKRGKKRDKKRKVVGMQVQTHQI